MFDTINFVILLIPIVFMIINELDINLDYLKNYFYIFGCFCFFVVRDYNINHMFYTSQLINLYILFVLLSVYLFDLKRSFKEALCLGFLTVYLNSYYWESMLHFASYMHGYIGLNEFLQFWRLIPFVYFYFYYEYEDKSIFRYVIIGLIFSSLLVLLRAFLIFFKMGYLNAYINNLNRFICLLILVYVVNKLKKKEKGF